MSAVVAEKLGAGDRCLASLQQQLRAIASPWGPDYTSLFPNIPALPTAREEEWQFTDLRDLYAVDWQAAPNATLSPSDAAPFQLPEAPHSRLVLVNGRYAPDLSDLSDLGAGISVSSFAQLDSERRAKLNYYLSQSMAGDSFEQLNRSGFGDLAVIWAEKDAIAPRPLHLLHLAAAAQTPLWMQPRIVAIAEAGAKLQLVEYYGAITKNCSDVPQKNSYWVNTATEIYLGDSAHLNHSRIQREAGGCFHIGNSTTYQAKNSHYTLNDFHLGGQLSRHNLRVVQKGEQTETYLNGLTAIAQAQTSDTHSEVRLQYPHGTVSQLHKCILSDRAHGVFSGKIFVPKAAQMTNATQLNRNLLLSPKTRINTKPELQITADNVKCAHGATVSQLEADELFYLQSRGLTQTAARNLLLDAFAAEICDRLPLSSLRQRLMQCLTCRTV